MNENNRILKKTFLTYLVMIGSLIGLLIVLLFLPLIPDVKWSIFLVVIVILLIISLYFKPRIEYYSHQTRMDELLLNSNPPIAAPLEISSDAWMVATKNMGFIFNKEFKDYFLAHRIHMDSTSIMTKRGILEVIVYIRNSDLNYTDDRYNRVIRQIEDEYAKTKNRYHHYTIFIIKSEDQFNDEIKKSVDEVYFNKSNHRFITIIHGCAIQKTKQFYFLHSDQKSPNLFYQEATQVLKEIIGIPRT